MAIVGKCDRCGEVYEYKSTLKTGDIRACRWTGTTFMRLDLCRSCQGDFETFMRNEPIVERRDHNTISRKLKEVGNVSEDTNKALMDAVTQYEEWLRHNVPEGIVELCMSIGTEYEDVIDDIIDEFFKEERRKDNWVESVLCGGKHCRPSRKSE